MPVEHRKLIVVLLGTLASVNCLGSEDDLIVTEEIGPPVVKESLLIVCRAIYLRSQSAVKRLKLILSVSMYASADALPRLKYGLHATDSFDGSTHSTGLRGNSPNDHDGIFDGPRLRAYERRLYDCSARPVVHADIGSCPTQVISDGLLRGHIKFAGSLFDCRQASREVLCNSSEVKVSQSGGDEDSLVHLANLADTHRSTVAHLVASQWGYSSPFAVGSNRYRLVAVAANHNDSSKSALREEQQPNKAQAPKFMRISGREKFAEASWGDKQTGGSVFNTNARDIDVSYDGKHWFNLMGGVCIQKLSPFAWDK